MNKIKEICLTKINKPLIQKLFNKKIGRLLFLFIAAIIIIFVSMLDTDSISELTATIVDITMLLVFTLVAMWRLNDTGYSKWWALILLVMFGLAYIDSEIIMGVFSILVLATTVLLSYLPPKKVENLITTEIANNMKPKNKILNKKTIIAFILGLAIMFGGTYLFNKFKSNCFLNNVGIIDLFGEIDILEDPEYVSVGSLNVIEQIETLDADSAIKGIVLNISSPGGLMQSSEDVMLAVQRTTKPVVAVIRDVGASAGYLIASGSDRIYASRLSDVGSIGVTQGFLDISEANRRDGKIYYDFSSGKYKGAFKENSKITQEQRDKAMEGIMKSHDIFVEYIAENRNIPIEEVKLLATGEAWGGDDALKLGLIDQIGGMQEAGVWLKEQIGEDPSYCYISR